MDKAIIRQARLLGTAALCLLALGSGAAESRTGGRTTAKQRSLDEWRGLTSPAAPPPRVFVKGDHARFFFYGQTNVEAFSAHWSRLRVPTGPFRVNSALLHWEQRLPRVPEHDRAWREATVIAGAEWRRLATNLVAALTPPRPGHGAYYQAFLADGVLYRDQQGAPRFSPQGEPPKGVVMDRRYSVDETLEAMARRVEQHLADTHPGGSLFVLMAPNASRFTQPLLLDRKQRQCVLLSPAALYDSNERELGPTATAQGLSALLPESHGLALIKNPVSSAARLADLGVETLVKFARLPLPKPRRHVPSLARTNGMDLAAWEAWMDRYTGTRRQAGSLQLLIDGDRFFSRLRQAVAEATNHIHINMYIFDRDDVAVAVADQLKQRSAQVEVKVILDRMGSIGAGVVPPATPLPEDFVPPASISSYLAKNSRVQVRPFLNPWFSADHSKVILVDGNHAWLGGMNFGREYRYEWHDLMVELNGPAVASLENEFRRQWAHAGLFGDLAYTVALLSGPKGDEGAATRGKRQTNKTTGPCPSPPVPRPSTLDPGTSVRLLPTKTAWKPFSAAVQGALRRARSYVYVENPYLFDKRVILSLVKARERGVDVRIVLPCVNDFKAGGRGNVVIANYLLEHGVRVYFYPGMTHVKALLVDDWACIGSGNLNHLSLRLNQEQNVATSNPAFAGRLKHDLFEQDFAHSYELKDPLSVDWVDFLADFVLEGF